MRIVLTGGGTAGHVAPLVPVIDALRTAHQRERDNLPYDREPGVLSLTFAGVVSKEVRELLSHHDVKAVHVPGGKLRRYASIQNVIDLVFKLPLGIVVALFVMWRLMPDAVVSKGGYGSVPVVLAAAWYRIPIFLHESDVIPGLANRICARFASVIGVGFNLNTELAYPQRKKVVVTGVPVAHELELVSRAEGRAAFGLPADKPVLLVVGGSQGAHQLNELVLAVLPQLIPEMAILHVTGEPHHAAVSAVAEELLASSPHRTHYQAHGYLRDQMAAAYAAADAVVARAGATTLAELARLKKPALLVPLPPPAAAGDHQRKNAAYFEQRGAARVLDPLNLTPHLFERSVRDVVLNETTRTTLSRNIAALDHPEAARVIGELALRLAAGYRPVRDTAA